MPTIVVTFEEVRKQPPLPPLPPMRARAMTVEPVRLIEHQERSAPYWLQRAVVYTTINLIAGGAVILLSAWMVREILQAGGS